jgi:hypothetical protein
MTTAVFVPSAPGSDYPDLTGVYDLTGLITNGDELMGSPTGTRQTAVLTIAGSRHDSTYAGTFTDFRFIYPDYEPWNGGGGTVTGSFDRFGLAIIELTFTGSQKPYLSLKGELDSGRVTGTYAELHHTHGTFTAVRRDVDPASP